MGGGRNPDICNGVTNNNKEKKNYNVNGDEHFLEK